jgi:hypothetical protein
VLDTIEYYLGKEVKQSTFKTSTIKDYDYLN